MSLRPVRECEPYGTFPIPRDPFLVEPKPAPPQVTDGLQQAAERLRVAFGAGALAVAEKWAAQDWHFLRLVEELKKSSEAERSATPAGESSPCEPPEVVAG